MGKVIIHGDTTSDPITTIGKYSGICYGADTTDIHKNYKRGLENIKSNHGRTLEYVQVYFTLEGYSAKVIREWYTHLSGAPSRLQSSTRYINYGDFKFVTPPSIAKSVDLANRYENCMSQISETIKDLEAWGVPKEDASMLLPLGMETKVVVRTNLRNLIDMSRQRMCNRAFWEYRQLFNDLRRALMNISEEWKTVVDMTFHPKCEELGRCPETHGCGRYK